MKPILISVAGGSASGKTTVVQEIIEAMSDYKITVLFHDDYYKDQSDIPMEQRIVTNYDHPSSLDNDLLVEHLNKLLNNEPINKPIYDFKNHNRSDKTEVVYSSNIIILEGILVLADKRLRELSDIKIYVESDDDIRFIRRLQRDIEERGRTVDSVVNQYLSTVKPMHYKFVKPSKRFADIIIPNDNKHNVAVDIIVTKMKDIMKGWFDGRYYWCNA